MKRKEKSCQQASACGQGQRKMHVACAMAIEVGVSLNTGVGTWIGNCAGNMLSFVGRLSSCIGCTPKTRERQRGGWQKKLWGGGGTSRGDPPRKAVSDPPHLSTFCPPPPFYFSYQVPWKFPEFPSGDPSETAFGGSISKSGFHRAVLARFCFSVRFAPPSRFALPSRKRVVMPKHATLRGVLRRFLQVLPSKGPRMVRKKAESVGLILKLQALEIHVPGTFNAKKHYHFTSQPLRGDGLNDNLKVHRRCFKESKS